MLKLGLSSLIISLAVLAIFIGLSLQLGVSAHTTTQVQNHHPDPPSNATNISTSFYEAGLPANSIWAVNYDQLESNSIAGSEITFNTTNGTYAFTIPSVTYGNATYTTANSIGNLTAGLSITVNFTSTPLPTTSTSTSTTTSSTSTTTSSTSTTTSITSSTTTSTTTVPINGLNVTTTVNEIVNQNVYLNLSINETLGRLRTVFGNRSIAIINASSYRHGRRTSNSGQANFTLNLSQLGNLTALTHNETSLLLDYFHHARLMNSSNSTSIINYSVHVGYGRLFSGGRYPGVGSNLTYAAYVGGHGLYIYKVNISKAQYPLNFTVMGINVNKPDTTVTINPAVINGSLGINGPKFYNITLPFNATLLSGNNATFTYSVKDLSTGAVVAHGEVNGSNIYAPVQIDAPVTDSLNITFSMAGNANYTSIDPSVLIVPSSILHYVAITFTNQQTASVSARTPLSFTYNAIAYQSYEACNLDNSELFYANGTEATSWLEGNLLNEYVANGLCASSSTPNALSASNDIIWWLKSPNTNTFLGANTGTATTNTIYLGWASTGTNLFSNTTDGEAPQLSCYNPGLYYTLIDDDYGIGGCGGGFSGLPLYLGEYDNGNYVFSQYTNFTINEVPYPTYNYVTNDISGSAWGSYLLSIGGISDSESGNAVIQYTTALPQNVITEAYSPGYSGGSNTQYYLLGESKSETPDSTEYPSWLQNSYASYFAPTSSFGPLFSTAWTNTASLTTFGSTYSTVSTQGTNTPILDGFVWTSAPAEQVIYNNYVPVLTNTAANITTGNSIYPYVSSYGVSVSGYFLSYSWWRTRIAPPDLVMPSSTVGSAIVALRASAPTSSVPVIITGNSITLTASWSGGTSTYTVVWYTGPSTNTCAKDSSNVLATYSGLSGTTNSLVVSPTTTNGYCIGVTDSSAPANQVADSTTHTVYVIQHYIPITFTNSQTAAVAGNTPLSFTYNAIQYQSYEACNLDNSMLFYANGTEATSWLEGNSLNEMAANALCASSSTTNALSASSNALWWFKSPPSNTFLGANTGTATTNTIYLGWAATSINLFSILSPDGEAPQLSCSNPGWGVGSGVGLNQGPTNGCNSNQYGEYDNGGSIFSQYTNFTGPIASFENSYTVANVNANSCPQGAPTVDDGFSMPSPYAYVSVPPHGTFVCENINGNVLIASNNAFSKNVITDAYLTGYTSQTTPVFYLMLGEATSASEIPGDMGVGPLQDSYWSALHPTISLGTGSSIGDTTTSALNFISTVLTPLITPNTTEVTSFVWSSAPINQVMYNTYKPPLSTQNTVVSSASTIYPYIMGNMTVGETATYQWWRTRIAPPNLIAPSFIVNPAVQGLTVNAPTPSSSVIFVGNSINLTSSWQNGAAPYSVTWYTGAPGNTCAQDSSNVVATYNGISGLSNSTAVSPTSTSSYCISVTDSETTPVTVNSLTTNVVVALYYVPITFTNQQSTAVAGNTPLLFTFNALKYQSYEACNLDNQILFYPNGTEATSWLEGNLTNGLQANPLCSSYTGTNILASSSNIAEWFKSPPTNTFLGANTGTATTNTIYLGWTATSTNLFSNSVDGEAPQLSCQNPVNTVIGCGTNEYGEYDTGNLVFGGNLDGFNTLYTNSAGKSIALWSTANSVGAPNSVIANNGLIATMLGSAASGSAFSKTFYLVPNVVIDAYETQLTSSNIIAFNKDYQQANIGFTPFTENSGWLFKYVFTNSNTVAEWVTQAQAGNVIGFSQSPPTLINNVVSGAWLTSNAPMQFVNYAGTSTSTASTYTLASTTQNPLWFALSQSTYGTTFEQVEMYWLDVRIAPPNGVMPSASFGSVIQPLNPTQSVSNVMIDGQQYLNITAYTNGGTSPYSYNFIISNSANTVLVSQVYSNVVASSNSFVWQVANSYAGNIASVNVIVTDSASTPVTANSVKTTNITLSAPLQSTGWACPATVDAGQSATCTATVSGGTNSLIYGSFNSFAQSGISIANSNNLPYGHTAISLFGWVYPVATPGTNEIFEYGTATAGNFINFRTASPDIGIFTSGGTSASSTLAFTVNQWNFVGFTCSASCTSVIFYLNGASQTVALSSGAWNTIKSTNPVVLGGSSSTSWNGFMANFQIYNVSITSAQANALYVEGISGSPITFNGLLDWWLLNGEGNFVGVNVIDYSHYQNYGTPTNVVFTTSPNAFTYNDLIYASNGLLVANQLANSANGVLGIPATSNSFTFSTTGFAAGVYTANTIDHDLATTYNTVTNSITFTVDNALVANAPTPNSPTIDSGQGVVLSANPSGGTGTYSYQWYVTTGSTGTCTTANTLITGATNNNILVTNTITVLYCYTLTDTSTNAPVVTSPNDLVTVKPALLANAITPNASIIDSGQGVVLSANPSGGTGTYSYQWYVTTGSTGTCTTANTLITGATNNNILVTNTITVLYCYTLTDTSTNAPVVTSPNDLVTVKPALLANAITPNAPTIDSGQSVTLTANPSGGTGTYSYQWYVTKGSIGTCTTANTLIVGATSSTFLASNTQTLLFCYTVTDTSTNAPIVTSPNDLVTVEPALVAGSPTPTTPTIDSGQGVVLSANPSGGTGTYSYQWYVTKGSTGTCSTSNTLISGSTANNFLVTNTMSLLFCYTVTDTSTNAPVVTSPNDLVTVKPALLANAITPNAPTIDSGQGVTLTANPSGGTGTYSYQWYVTKGSIGTCTTANTLIVGATSSTFLASNTQTLLFCYTVTDTSTNAPIVTSPNDLVTVEPALVAGSPTPTTPTIDSGQGVTLTANPSGGTGTYSYQWYVTKGSTGTCSTSNTLISGSTANNFLVTNTMSLLFCYTVTDTSTNAPIVTSPNDLVTVNPSLTMVSWSVTNPKVDIGETETFNAVISGGTSPYTYNFLVYNTIPTLAFNSLGTNALTSNTFTITQTGNAGTWTANIIVTDNAYSPNSISNSLTYTVNNALAPTQGVSNVMIDGQQYLNITAYTNGGTSPYSYNFIISNSANTVLVSQVYSNVVASSNSFVWQVANSYAGNIISVNVIVTDSATIPVTTNSIKTTNITLSAPLQSTGWACPAVVDAGQPATCTAMISGGTNSITFGKFNGVSSIVSVPNSNALNPTSITLGFWFMEANSPVSNSDRIISKNAAGTDLYGFYITGVSIGSRITTTSGSGFYNPSITLATNTLYYGTMTYNGASNALSLYINGQLIGTSTSTETGPLLSYNTPLCLGYACASASGSNFNGSLTNVQIYSTPLTAAQVNSIYQEGISGPPITFNGLVGWWLLNGNGNFVGANVIDYSRYQGYGTPTNVLYTTSPNAFTYNDLIYASNGLLVANQLANSANGALGIPSTSNTFTFSTAGFAAGTYTANTIDHDLATTYNTVTNSITFTVDNALVANAPTPNSPTIDSGQGVVLSANPSGGTGTYSYQWYVTTGSTGTCTTANTLITGATNNNILVTNTITVLYCYTLTDTSTNAPVVTSPNDLVTVKPALLANAITPNASIIDSGQGVVLSANPSGGTGTYSYQWYVTTGSTGTCTTANTLITGATNNNILVTNTITVLYCYTLTDTSTNAPVVTSPNDLVTVKPALLANAITPNAPTIDSGQSVTLTANPSGGTGTYSYQWYVTKGSIGTCTTANTLIVGATSSTFLASNTQTLLFCYTVTDTSTNAPIVTSPNDLVTVEPALVAGSPTPTTPTIDSGQGVVLSANPSGGTGTYSYQWYVTKGSTGTCSTSNTLISGSTANNFLVTNTMSLLFCYTVTDTSTNAPVVTSPNDLVTVKPALLANAITPNAPTIDSGQGVTLTANPSGGTGTYSYQWYVTKGSIGTCTTANTLIVGATSSTFLASNTQTLLFCYTVTDTSTNAPIVTSPNDLVTVEPALVAGSPTPTTPTIDSGQGVTLTANPSGGTGTYSYQWYVTKGSTGTCSTSNTLISGSTANNFLVTNTMSLLFCYTVTDTSTNAPIVTSPNDLVTVNPSLTMVSWSVTNPKVDIGETETFNAVISGGTSPYTYNFLVYNTIPALAFNSLGTNALTSNTFTITQTGNAGTWTANVIVTDNAYLPNSISNTLTYTVNNALAPTQGVSNVMIDGQQYLNITAYTNGGTSPYSYNFIISNSANTVLVSQVYSNVVASSNSFVWQVANSYAGNIISVNVIVTDSATIPVTTNSIKTTNITLSAPLQSTGWVCPAIVDAGQSATCTATVSGGTNSITFGNFNGLSEVSVPDSNALNPNSITIGLWLSTNGLPTGSWRVISKNAAGADLWSFFVNTNAVSVGTRITTTSGSGFLDSASGIAVNTLYYATVTYSATSNVLAIYLNGALITSSNTVETGPLSIYNTPVCIGFACGSGAGAENWNGIITNVQIYNTSLTAAEVNSIYKEGITGGPLAGNGLVGWWLLNGNGNFVGANVIDYSHYQDYGTPSGVTYATSTNAFTYNNLIYAPNGMLVANQLANSANRALGIPSTSNTFTFSTAGFAAGTYTANTIDHDLATTYNTVTNSITFTVDNVLVANPPTPNSPTIDSGQGVVLSANPSGGTGTYSYQWYVTTGSTGTCTTANTLITGATNNNILVTNTITVLYCYTLTDTSTNAPVVTSPNDLVTVKPALLANAITPNAPTIDSGQGVTLTANPSGGTGTYSYQWYVTKGSIGTCTTANTLIVGATSNTFLASNTQTLLFCYTATDTSTNAPIVTSPNDLVTVSPMLSVNALIPKSPKIDSGQSVTLTGNWLGGTANYEVIWYTGASTNTCAQDSSNVVATYNGVTGLTNSLVVSPTSTNSYCIVVTDNALSPVTANSPADIVTVNPALVAGNPTPASATIGIGQVIDLTAHPSGGTTPYSYQWYSSTGSSCSPADTVVANGMSDVVSNAPTQNTLFCYTVTDNSLFPVTLTSGNSLINVASTLETPTLSPASPTIDIGQSITLTASWGGGTPDYKVIWYTGAAGNTCAQDSSNVLATYNGLSQLSNSISVSPTSTSSYCMSVTDNELTPSTVNSTADIVTVSPALISTGWSVSNLTIDVGQTQTFNAVVSGGTPPYTYNFLIYNTIPLLAFSSVNTNANTFNTSAITQTGDAGTWTANIIVNDSAYSPVFVTNTLTYTVNNALLATASPASNSIFAGSNAVISGSTSGGTPPITSYQWLATAINGNTFTADQANTLCGAAAQTAACTLTTAVSSVSGTYGFQLEATDSASTPDTATSSTANVVVSSVCTISLAQNAIDFGSIEPTYSIATSNGVTDTNSGGSYAYIYVSGGDWAAPGALTFGVSNTVWAGSANTAYASANALTSALANSLIAVPGLSSNTIYFGVGIPAGTTGASYTQNIVIENGC